MPEDAPKHAFRKLLLLIIVGVWAALTLGVAATDLPDELLYALTAFVFLAVGRMWNLELERFNLPGISIEPRRDDSEDDSQ